MVHQLQLLKLPQKANCEGTGQKSEKAICEMNESNLVLDLTPKLSDLVLLDKWRRFQQRVAKMRICYT